MLVIIMGVLSFEVPITDEGTIFWTFLKGL